MSFTIVIPSADNYYRMHKCIDSLYNNYSLDFISSLNIWFLCSSCDPSDWFDSHYSEVKYFKSTKSTNSELIKEFIINSYKSITAEFDEYLVILSDYTRLNRRFFSELDSHLSYLDLHQDINSLVLVKSPSLKKDPRTPILHYQMSDYSEATLDSYLGVVLRSRDQSYFEEPSGNFVSQVILKDYLAGKKVYGGISSSESRLKLNKSLELLNLSQTQNHEKSGIGIVTFINSSDYNGVTTSTFYLQSYLKNYFDKVDLLTPLIDNGFNDKMIHTEDFETFNNYQYLIFTTPGILNEKPDQFSEFFYTNLLKKVDTPFSFIVHGELYSNLLPYYKKFLTHPYCKSIIYNAPGMEDLFKDYQEIVPKCDFLNFLPPIEPLGKIIEKAKFKKRILASTCRWIPMKRVRELILMSPDLHSSGIGVLIRGSQASTFYVKKIKEDLLFNPKFLGKSKDSVSEEEVLEFTRPPINKIIENYNFNKYLTVGKKYLPSELSEILTEVKWHYNLAYLLRSDARRSEIIPRIEIASIEAFNEGCLPIVCKETTPEWLGEDSLIRISKNEIEKLPELLSSMTDDEIFSRLTKFYDLLKIQTEDVYSQFTNSIKEVIKEYYHE